LLLKPVYLVGLIGSIDETPVVFEYAEEHYSWCRMITVSTCHYNRT